MMVNLITSKAGMANPADPPSIETAHSSVLMTQGTAPSKLLFPFLQDDIAHGESVKIGVNRSSSCEMEEVKNYGIDNFLKKKLRK